MKLPNQIIKLQRELIGREKLPFRYAGALALIVANDFSEKAREAAFRWCEGEEIKEVVIGEYSIETIMEKTGASEFEALLMADSFAKNMEICGLPVWRMRRDEFIVSKK